MRQCYAGLDPSLANTAFVVLSPKGEIRLLLNSHDEVPPRAKRQKTPREHDALQRMLCIQAYLDRTVALAGPGVSWDQLQVAYEDYSFNSVHRAFTLGELGGILKSNFLLKGVPLHLVEPKVLKKFALGTGAASKQAVLEQAKAEMRFEDPSLLSAALATLTDDAADAYFLAKYLWYQKAPKQAITYETSRDRLRKRLEYVRQASSG